MINASSKVRLYINNLEYSDYLIEGSLSDDSVYTSNIVTTRGTIVLGGDTSIIDFKKDLFPVGSTVTIYGTLTNGKLAKLPRGHLYVLNSTINVNERLTTLEVGCSLAFLSTREAHYEDEIKTLIEGSFDTNFKNSFLVDEYNLSTLDNLLKTAGKCIFQDKYGYVQTINQFGEDGLGANVRESKLTSFDKYSAINIDSLGGSIEELPSTVFVEAEINVPGESDDDNAGNDGKPEPFISSTVQRTVSYTDAGRDRYEIVNDLAGGQSTTEAIPSCGSIEEPGEPTTPDFAYTVFGNAFTIEKTNSEEAVSGSYSRYDGPGNQLDWEYNFEWCSALTYASDILTTVVNKYVEFANEEREKGKAMLSRANQYFAAAKDFNERDLTGKSEQEVERIKNSYEYYTCLGTQLFDAAVDIVGDVAGDFGGNAMSFKATKFIDEKTSIYGISNMSQTFYEYGKGDVLVKKVQLEYIHFSQSEIARKTTEDLQPFFGLNANLDGFRYSVISDIDFAGYRGFKDVVGFQVSVPKTFEQTISGSSLPTSHDDQKFLRPDTHFNQFLRSRTTTTYYYGSNYTTEVVLFEDFENSDNNYKRNNFSSSGSKNAEESDRIELQRDANGCIYTNNQNADEPVTLQYTATVKENSGTVSAGWLGVPSSTQKEISIPATFAPIAKKNCDGTITSPNVSAVLANYQSIIENFANNEAKRIAGDNLGYRITESGVRAEVFDYYPFYPITLLLSSLGKQFKLRAAASSWVFDSSNVLCSFDCFSVGEVATIEGETELSPSDFTDTSIIGTSSTFVLGSSFFNLPENAASIALTFLSPGATFSNGGTTLSVGDQITVADINGGNITATTNGSTANVSVSYTVTKTNGNIFDGLDDVFPPDSVDYVENPFADGGEFTDDTTNGGNNADAGEFTTSTNGSGVSLNAGDFDTGATVLRGEPLAHSSASTGNNTVDPEAELGVQLVDGAGTTLSSDTLSTPHGAIDPTLEIVLDFTLNVGIKLTLDAILEPQSGWDYGYVSVSRGTSIDMGTVVDPNNYVMNFGTVATANEPVLASGVV